jgi:hypothetical protein
MNNDIILGAKIALAGALVGQLVSIVLYFLERRGRKHAILREKCELLSDYVIQGNLWFNKLTLCYSFADLNKCPPPIEATKAAMLAKLYFPELDEPATDYCNCMVKFHHYLVDSFYPMEDALPVSVVARVIGKDKETYFKWDDKITTLKNRLQEGIAAQAKKHL